MPKKKTKGTKKKKKSTKEKKEGEEEKKNLYDIPEYLDPKLYTPKVKLKIKAVEPIAQELGFELEDVMVTVRVADIIRKIILEHDGSIKNVKIGLNSYSEHTRLDPNKTLKEEGISTAGEYTLIYDFEASSYPLLNTALPDPYVLKAK